MKLKTRLVVSFLIIMIVPCVLAFIAFSGMKKLSGGTERVSLKSEVKYLTNSLNLLNVYSDDNLIKVEKWLKDTDTDKINQSTVKKFDLTLRQNYSYLIVLKGNKLIYNGDVDGEDEVSQKKLPKFCNPDQRVELITYTKDDKPILWKKLNFKYGKDKSGTIYLVTSANSIKPETKRIAADFVISAFVVLLLTGVIMVLWNYRGIVPRVEMLCEAANEIRKGNLNNEIYTEGNDEITELYRAFEEMRKRLLATSKEKMRNEEEQRQLISNIVHDLKTPITAIKGYAEGVLDGVAATPEKRDSYLRTIVHKANDMNALINELSLYTKIDTNRIPYNFTMIPANQFFRETADEIEMDLANQKIRFNFKSEVEDGVKVIADRQQLERVIHNIISNSVKYMGQKTEEDPGRIDMTILDLGDSVQVEIRDNGIGISSNDLPHIFDRLFRADTSRNSSTGGSGIGLSIVKKIIDDHGGNIWATSTEGAGTAMYFMLRKKMEEKNVKNFDSRGRRGNRKPGERLSGIKRVRGKS